MNKLLQRKPFFLCLAASFALLLVDYQFQLTQPLQYALNQSLVLPARRVLGLPVSIIEYGNENLHRYSTLLRENHHLKTLNAELQVRLTELDALQLENDDFRAALEHDPAFARQFVHAEVVQILYRQNRAILVVNRTDQDGIKVDQMVLDRKGLVGRIIAVFQNNSHVQMISDNEHYISAFTEGNIHTIVQGRGLGNDLAAQYIPSFADVKVGETVYSSGLDDIYPARFPIGVVHSVEHNTGGDFGVITVKPYAGLQSNRDLYIVTEADAPEAESSPNE
ncbi:MAG: rod shape-determining protein MreC [Gammaproteobacteria bacterium]|nr:rod shape-determining protein MreC [Gammaproteobacteria bacterium]